jgi:hypothetical protein
MNPFIDLIINAHKYTYECNGKTVQFNDEPAEHDHGKWLVVRCEKCCNVPVLHLLKKT